MEVIVSIGKSQGLFDVPNGIVKMYFCGDMSDEAYKEFWTKCIDFVEQRQISRIIIDQREIGNVSFNARGWVVISAFPRVKKVLPPHLVASVLSSDRIVQKTGMQYLLKAFRTLTGFTVELHPSHEAAVAFLTKNSTSMAVTA